VALELSRKVEAMLVVCSENLDRVHSRDGEGEALAPRVFQQRVREVEFVLVKDDAETGLFSSWGLGADLELVEDGPVDECLWCDGLYEGEKAGAVDQNDPAVEVDLLEAERHPWLAGCGVHAEYALKAATRVVWLGGIFFPQLELHIFAYGTDVGASEWSVPVCL
jgi:hypothetical protein